MQKPPLEGGMNSQRAITAAFDAHADALFQYAHMLLADHAGAEDAVQQVFVRLATHGPSLSDAANVGAYLRTAVRHECYRALRWRRRRRREIEISRTPALLEPVAPPSAAYDGELKVVEQVLRSLPPEQREVVYFKVYEGMTFRQISGALGVRLNTVTSRYRRAVEKLRFLLVDKD